ncbi:MAG: MFS transporter [Polyangiaceae bacterium]|nr:MFS transporter [Polyangiaceae bacterium]MBK8937500.1 MFS transporter [Polyangiaceae bacterium]
MASEAKKKSPLQLLVDVKASEVAPMVVSALWIFLAITAYYIIKPIRGETLQKLILVDNKPKALVLTTIFIGFFAYFYGKVVSRIERKRLIVTTYLIFIGCIGAFAGVMPHANWVTGYIFFVWVSTFSVMVVSQFWALQADVWTKEEGTRLFGFIGLGTVSGGIAGTFVTAMAKGVATWKLLLASAGILVVCLGLSLYILAFATKKPHDPPKPDLPPSDGEPKDVKPPDGSSGVAKPPDTPKASNAIAMVLSSPYLRLIAAMTLILNLVNSNNEWILDKLFSKMGDGDARTFYADFYLWQNIFAAAIQFLLTGPIQRHFGARVALLFLPLVGMLGGSAFLLIPTLAVIRLQKIAENATDYSIQSNTREFLYLPTSKIEKYAAKNVNDTFVVRTGDLLAAGSIEIAKLLLASVGDNGLRILVGANLVLGAAWIVIVLRIGVLNKRMMSAHHG